MTADCLCLCVRIVDVNVLCSEPQLDVKALCLDYGYTTCVVRYENHV